MTGLRTALLCLLLVAASPLLSSCQPGTTPPPPSPELSIAFDLWPGYYPAIIAAEKAWFKAEGITVHLQTPVETNRLVATFAARQYDLAGLALGDAMRAARANPDLFVIAKVDDSRGADVIMGMTTAEPAKLRGKRIGVSLGGFGELLVKKFLDSRGLRRNEVSLVHASASQVPTLLQEGKIDFGHTWEPYASEARDHGAISAYSSADSPGFIADVLVVQGKILRKHPEQLKAFLRAWFRARDWWLQHPEEGNQLIARYLRQKPEHVSLEGIALTSLAENHVAFRGTGPESMSGLMQAYQAYFMRRSLVTRPLPDSFISGAVLP